ncbi:MAG: YbjN domain-containing protein [Verrucomicrobiota bacterium]|nr:YbjN domain-containing protein [Verrucomicrobiota bacterium]
MQNTGSLLIKVKESFDSAKWQFREVPEKKVIESEFEAHHGKVPLHVQAFEELGAISVVSRLSFTVNSAAQASIHDALMRTNITLNIGNFETNPENGEVYFRITNVFSDGQCDAGVITSLVRTAIVEMDRITPYLAEIMRDPNQSISHLLARKDLLPEIKSDFDSEIK